jgi:hypothetical protein
MMPVRAVVVDTFEERRLLNCYISLRNRFMVGSSFESLGQGRERGGRVRSGHLRAAALPRGLAYHQAL